MADKKLDFSTDDLTFTPDGRVIIDNASVAKSLMERIRSIDPAASAIFDNCSCTRSDALSEVSLVGKLKSQKLSLGMKASSGIFDNCSCTGN
jgi:hypothetical protein